MSRTESPDQSPGQSTGASTDRAATGLRRVVPGWVLVLFVIGDVLGAGIYTLVGQVSAEVGGAIWAPLLVAFGLAMLTAASYAEMVTRFPRAGGAAVHVERAFRTPVASFLVGTSMLAAGLVSAAALSVAFAGDYLAALVDLPAAPVAVAFLVVLALLNARGIKESLAANVVMTVVEIAGLVLVVALAAAVLGRGDGVVSQVGRIEGDGAGAVGAVAAATVLAFYSFVGFEVSANVAEEARDPRRAYPRALFLGLGAAAVLYVLVALAVAATVPLDRLTGSTAPLLEVVRVADAAVPEQVFSLVALVAVGNGALLALIMASRLAYGMARERLFPSVLARLLPRRRTPWAAIVATTAVAAVLAWTGDIASLAATTVLLLLVVFVAVNASVLALRWRERRGTAAGDSRADHFRTWWPLPVLAIAACVWLATQQPLHVYLRAGVLLAVLGLVWAVTRLVRRAG
ncbi:MAG: APC family permease [Kineosporiaceae bacterium]